MQDGPVAGLDESGAPIAGVYRHEQSKSIITISYEPSPARWLVGETRDGADVGTEVYVSRSAVEVLVATMMDEGYRRD